MLTPNGDTMTVNILKVVGVVHDHFDILRELGEIKQRERHVKALREVHMADILALTDDEVDSYFRTINAR